MIKDSLHDELFAVILMMLYVPPVEINRSMKLVRCLREVINAQQETPVMIKA